MTKNISNEQLKKILLEGGFLEEEQVKQLELVAKAKEKSLAEVIVEKDMMSDDNLGRLIASELGVPFVNLATTYVDDQLLELIPEMFARENMIVPFKQDGKGVHVATNHVKDTHLIQQLEKRFGADVIVHYASANGVRQALNKYKRGFGIEVQTLARQALDGERVEIDQDTVIVEIVNRLLDYAYASKASDLHIEPQDVGTVIRFRVDGVLHDMMTLQKELHDRIVSRVKIMSHLRTDEHFAAQDGHLKYSFGDEGVDVRVSILPTTFGEKVAMRLLSEKARQFSLEEIGLSDKDLKLLKIHAKKPWGMILVTGPTGCGKTTTLYAVLKVLNKREVNISTIEDPVEYSIPGVNQIQVNRKTELTFAKGLRSIVRQDPDIIMVGEIRDKETADISVNASLTGHLLLSTLHTNDAPTALLRLLDMEMEPFLVASTVNVVIAQRLVRKICKHCVRSQEVALADLEEQGFFVPEGIKNKIFAGGVGKRRLYKGVGCETCQQSGYIGRTGVFEILEVDPEIKNMVLENRSSDEIRNYAISQGMTTMFDDAVDKVLSGETTIEEVLRVVRE